MNANPKESLCKIGIERIQKKFREAKFFLSHMMQAARSTRLDHEHVEFNLRRPERICLISCTILARRGTHGHNRAVEG